MSLSCERVIDRTADEESYLDNRFPSFIHDLNLQSDINKERFIAIEKDIQAIFDAINNLNNCVNKVLQRLDCVTIKSKKR